MFLTFIFQFILSEGSRIQIPNCSVKNINQSVLYESYIIFSLSLNSDCIPVKYYL